MYSVRESCQFQKMYSLGAISSVENASSRPHECEHVTVGPTQARLDPLIEVNATLSYEPGPHRHHFISTTCSERARNSDGKLFRELCPPPSEAWMCARSAAIAFSLPSSPVEVFSRDVPQNGHVQRYPASGSSRVRRRRWLSPPLALTGVMSGWPRLRNAWHSDRVPRASHAKRGRLSIRSLSTWVKQAPPSWRLGVGGGLVVPYSFLFFFLRW